MDLTEFRRPGEKAAPTGPGAGPWRTTAYVAGFFGALPFGLLPFFLATQWKRPHFSTSEYLLFGPLGTLSLVPFAGAMARAGQDAWPRALTLVIPTLAVGTFAVFLSPLVLIVDLAAGWLGLLLGLAALGPCWWRGDAEGRALALLGTAPALWLLELQAADRVSRRYPALTAAPDLSRLSRWEYLLALVAVGLAVGVLRLFRLRRRRATATRLRGLDAAGAEASREGDSPGREFPSLDVAPGVAGPLKGVEARGRAERFRRHALALGFVWIVFGSILLLIGASNLWDYIPPRGSFPDAREWRQIRLCGGFAAYGLALAASGVGTCLRRRWAIVAGLALTCVVLALGFAVDGGLFAASFITLSLALIDLALRTTGLAAPPRHGGEVRRGVLAALRRVPARLAEAPTNRLAVAVLGCSLGGTVGGLAGGAAGYLIEGLAATACLVSNQWGLAPVFGLAVGAMGGGAGGWVGGLIQGAALGVSSPRLKAVRLSGGMVSGLSVVLVVFVRDVGIDWNRGGRWFESLEALLLAAATGALGAVTAGAVVGRLARAFADRGEGRAGTHPLDD